MLYLKSTCPLEVASTTGSGSVNITVMAWATDVELVIPTNETVSASKKKKKRQGVSFPRELKDSVIGTANKTYANLQQVEVPPDEKKDGVVSSISTVAAKVAGQLEDVPFIGDYAKMGKGIANGVTKAARFFGLSRPPIMTDSQYYKSAPFANTATTDGAETVSRLTFDPKQQITLNPSTVAMEQEDELAIKMFTEKETLISTFLWEAADAVDSEIFWANVTPNVGDYTPGSSLGKRYQMSSIDFASRPFKYWTGSLKYRFQFICSKYQTGRVRITYEPDGDAGSSSNFNTVYSQVIDLTEGTDVEFIVPWAQTVPYKEVMDIYVNNVFQPPSSIPVYFREFYNGIVYVQVLNELKSPDSTKPIYCNVYLSAGEDFALACPSSSLFEPTTNVPSPFADPAAVAANAASEGNTAEVASKGENVAASGIVRGNDNVADRRTELFGSTLTTEEQAQKTMVFMGEEVTSFRPLIKRYCLSSVRTTDSDTNPDNAILHNVYGTFHTPYPGAVSNASMATCQADINNFEVNAHIHWTFVNWLALGFLGARGSMRYKFLSTFDGVPPIMHGGGRAQNPPNPELNQYNWLKKAITSTTSKPRYNSTLALAMDSMWEGKIILPYDSGQPGVEIEMPWYSAYRFTTTSIIAWGGRQPFWDSDLGPVRPTRDCWHYQTFGRGSGTDSSAQVIIYTAAGEDFSFNFYMGPPPVYILDSVSAST